MSCHRTKDLHINAQRVNKCGSRTIWYMCRYCTRKRHGAYRKTDAGRAATRKASSNYDKKHTERRKAHDETQEWRLTHPNPVCRVCKTKMNVRRTFPDITRPNRPLLFCPKHHSAYLKAKRQREVP